MRWKPAKTIAERYAEATPEEYTGPGLIFWDDGERYFADLDDVLDYCHDDGIDPQSLKLFHTSPNYATPLRDDCLFDRWQEILPGDEGGIPQEILDAFKAFNDAIIACKTPLSWSPDFSRRVIIREAKNAD